MIKDKISVLQLERQFTLVTEAFIVNQINYTSHCRHNVFTMKEMKTLPCNAQVFSPDEIRSFLDLKLLRRKNVDFFAEKYNLIKPDIIHAHFATDARFFLPFSKNCKIAKVCSCYGYDVSKFPRQYGYLAKVYFKPLFKEYDLFLAMSEDMKADLLKIGCPESKIKVHYFGTNTKIFDFERNYRVIDTFNMLTVASLYYKKGHFSVLQALNMIVKKFPDLRIKYKIVGDDKIIGDGELREKLKRYIHSNSLSNYIEFTGVIKHGEEYNKVLSEAHLFVHPSVTSPKGDKEGIPGTIVEAMASGLPVISTYHAGIPSVIENDVNGFLVREHDYQAIADKILLLYHDEDLRRKIGEKAKKHTQTDLDLYAKTAELEEIYASLLS